MEATLVISDMRSEWELRLGACIKDHALSTGGLPRLPHEELLAGDRASAETPSCKVAPSRGKYMHHQVWGTTSESQEARLSNVCISLESMPITELIINLAHQVPAHMLGDMLAARKVALDILGPGAYSCFSDLKRALLLKAATLTAMDRTFRLELAFLESGCEVALASEVGHRLLQCMPTQSTHITLDQCQVKLQALRQSQLARMASLESQAEIDTVKDIVSNMQSSISPEPSIAQGGELFKQVLHRLQFFFSHSTVATKTKPAQVTYGLDALNLHFDEMSKLMNAGSGDITLQHLEIFQRGRYLLSAEQGSALSGWVKTVLKAAGTGGYTKMSAASSSSAAKSSKTAEADSAASSVLRFF
jgi:hypothetical protein